MIKKRLELYIEEALKVDGEKLALHKEEKAYAEKHGLIPDGVEVTEKEADTRFNDAYLERAEKETVELVVVESPKLLGEQVERLKRYRREFVYIESAAFDIIGVDAISLELDDVFETYTAMFGLKLQKKYEADIKAYLDEHLTGEESKYSIAFSMKDGLWDINFALSYADGFSEEMTLFEAYLLTFRFIFTLIETIEEIES